MKKLPGLFFLTFVLITVLLSGCNSASTPSPAVYKPVKVIAEWNKTLPEGIAFGFGSAWVPGHRDPRNTIRIDPNTNQVTATIDSTGSLAISILVAGDYVWVAGQNDDMSKIDPKTNMIVARVTGTHTFLAYAFGSIWSTTSEGEGRLDRIDPETAKIVTSIDLGTGHPENLNPVVATANALGVLNPDGTELIKIDPTTNAIVSKTLYTGLIKQAKLQTAQPQGKGTDFVWLVTTDPDNPQDCGLLQIDPSMTKGLAFWPVGVDCNPPTVTEKSIWLSGNAQIDRFNLAANKIDATYQVQNGASAVGIGFGSVWVLYEEPGIIQRLDITP